VYRYEVTARSQAEPATVYDVLLRTATWPSWSPIDSVEVQGDPAERQRVGDLRTFRTGRAVSPERITELVADRKFGYNNEGVLFRSYDAAIELAPAPGGGTDIRWSADFTPKLPLTGGFWRWYLTRFMKRMADGLAAYASQH
jgi:hypothetical protein